MKALVVGAGRMGAFHRRALRDLGLDVTTVDPDPAAGADFLRRPHRSFAVVCVAAPVDHLADEAAAWAGRTGWLLIEKPFAANLAQARTLAMLLEDQACAVGYVERFNPQARRLRALLHGEQPGGVMFTRWNDRPCVDPWLELATHDIDLAAWLGLECPVVFDTRADATTRIRHVTIDDSWAVDLMAHDTSPLHAQWHAFLSGQPGYATPRDAIRIHNTLANMTQEIQCA